MVDNNKLFKARVNRINFVYNFRFFLEMLIFLVFFGERKGIFK